MNTNGRDSHGRFGRGNGFAKGSPFAKRVNEVRAALIEAVTADDVRKIVARLVRLANMETQRVTLNGAWSEFDDDDDL